MNAHWVVMVAFLGIAACTTSGPGSPEPGVQADNPSAAAATDPAAVPTSPGAMDIADEDSVYCRKEKPTGTRIAKTVCMTHAERQRIRDASQFNAESAKRKPGAVPQDQ